MPRPRYSRGQHRPLSVVHLCGKLEQPRLVRVSLSPDRAALAAAPGAGRHARCRVLIVAAAVAADGFSRSRLALGRTGHRAKKLSKGDGRWVVKACQPTERPFAALRDRRGRDGAPEHAVIADGAAPAKVAMRSRSPSRVVRWLAGLPVQCRAKLCAEVIAALAFRGFVHCCSLPPRVALAPIDLPT